MSSNAIEKDCFVMLHQVEMWRAMTVLMHVEKGSHVQSQ